MTRVLHHIPILHSTADLGSFGGGNPPASGGARDALRNAIDEFWEGVATSVRELPMRDTSGRPLLVYQDGLPVCGEERRIIEETAAKGSRNFSILIDLLAAGCEVVGTESPELLMREYELLKAAAARPDPRHATRARAILEERDRFIAARIDATLEAGRVGLLLLGAAHGATRMLPGSIEVRTHNLLARAARAGSRP